MLNFELVRVLQRNKTNKMCVCMYFIYSRYIDVYIQVALTAQSVKNLPAMPETQVRSLGQEDPLEKEMATHSSILASRIPRTEEPGGLQSMVSQESNMT